MTTLLSMILAASMQPHSPTLRTVQVRAIDAENLVITSTQPIESVFIEGMYVNTDYTTDHDPVKNQVRIRLFTYRPLGVVEIETRVPRTKGLKRKHRIEVGT